MVVTKKDVSVIRLNKGELIFINNTKYIAKEDEILAVTNICMTEEKTYCSSIYQKIEEEFSIKHR